MYKFENDSYLGQVDNGNPIDWLETQFLGAGWSINKKYQEIAYDNGSGCLYPMTSVLYNRVSVLYPSASVNYYVGGIAGYDYFIGTQYNYTSPIFSQISGKIYPPDSYNTSFYNNFKVLQYKVRKSGLSTSGFTMYFLLPNGYKISNIWKNNTDLLQDFVSITTAVFIDDGSGQGRKTGTSFSANKGDYIWVEGDSSNSSLIATLGFRLSTPISLGLKSKELYVSSLTTSGETIYFSFQYDYLKGMMYVYGNTGYDTNLAVNRQPGVVKSVDSVYYDYYAFNINNFHFCSFPSEYYFIGDINHFFIGQYSQFDNPFHTSYSPSYNKSNQYVYGGVLEKFFNFTGGQVIYGSSPLVSSFYLLYEGNWYGESVSLSRTGKQGYIDMVTPSTYTTATYNTYTGELFLTQQIAGINTTTTNNGEYKPLGAMTNLFKHYGTLPDINMTIKVDNSNYLSIIKSGLNRLALKYS